MCGDFDCGDEEDDLGDALDLLQPTPARTPPAALWLDPMTRRHKMNADGTMTELHPVDAQVVNAMFIARGELASAATTGNALHKIRSPHDPRAGAQAEDAVRVALADLISRGDITLKKVQIEAVGQYRMDVAVYYFNERLLPRKEQRRAIEA